MKKRGVPVDVSTLVDDRKAICINYPSQNVISLYSSSFTAVPSSVSEGRSGGMVLKRMYGDGE